MSEILTLLLAKLEGWVDGLVLMAPNLVAAILVVVAFGLASKYLGRAVERLLARLSDHRSLNQLAAKLVRFGGVVIGGLVALHILHLDKAATTFLAGAGIVGIAIGFAFQDMSANLISGVAMAFKRPIRVGDLIESNDLFGTVDRIELRTTVILTPDGKLVRIPNKDIYQNPIINYTKRSTRRVDLQVGVAYDTDLELAARVAREAVEPIDRIPSRDVEVFYTEFGDSSIDLVVRFWIDYRRHADYMAARSRAMMGVKAGFDEHDITIPFPIRTLDFGDRDLAALSEAA